MTTNYRKLFSMLRTPQNQPIPGTAQEPNNAGGFAWTVDHWTRLDRFLILGSDQGSYYVGARTLTAENANAVLDCIQEDGVRVVERIVDISKAGRAAKNEPALFALALASGLGEVETRRAAMAALPDVARTGTHLFHFLEYVEGVRGWGRLLRNGVTGWYNGMDAGRLAYQAVKYQTRDGWSHRDALRLAKPVPATPAHDAVYGWITGGWDEIGPNLPEDEALRLIWVYEQAKRVTTVAEMVELIQTHRLTWEFVPAQWLGFTEVWRALLPNLPLTALIRNLGRLTANQVVGPLGKETRLVAAKLTDRDAIRQARVHPLALLVAMRTYAQGQGVRGSLKWEPERAVVDALDEAFYLAFENVTPTHKRIMLALDVSSSMTGPMIAGMPGVTPRVGSAALALITAKTETEYVVTAFTTAGKDALKSKQGNAWYETAISTLDISPRMRLDDVLRQVDNLPFGGTDCALPMLYALERRLKIDAFVIYTDSETWAGDIHPAQALQAYRQRMGIPARLVVVGMVSNGFSIADPNDAGMLDVVGFDTATPALINDFIADRLGS